MLLGFLCFMLAWIQYLPCVICDLRQSGDVPDDAWREQRAVVRCDNMCRVAEVWGLCDAVIGARALPLRPGAGGCEL